MTQRTFVPGRTWLRVNWLLTTLAWAIALVALSFAPDRVPVHWDGNGAPDRFLAPVPGLFVLPLIMTLLALGLPLLPRLDPRQQNYPAFASTYQAIQTGILAFLVVLHGVTTAVALGAVINMNLVMVLLVGLLLVGLGNVMGKLRPNWFVGIRTPWTLSSSDVWTRTHRFGGRVMVGFGLTLLVGGLLFPSSVSGRVLAVGACVLAALTFGYSYLVWRELDASRE